MILATYNLRAGGTGRSHWGRMLDQFHPDLLFIQETVDPIEHLPPMTYPECKGHYCWTKASGRRWGTAVYARQGKLRAIGLPDFHGLVLGVEVEGPTWPDGGNGPLRVFSVHAPRRISYTLAVGAILDMIAAHPGPGDVVIGGDFNLTVGVQDGPETAPTNAAEKAILRRFRDEFGLVNCWQAANPGLALAQTLRWSTDRTIPFHCDGLFVPRSWAARLTACEVISSPEWDALSDHNPVVARFEGSELRSKAGPSVRGLRILTADPPPPLRSDPVAATTEANHRPLTEALPMTPLGESIYRILIQRVGLPAPLITYPELIRKLPPLTPPYDNIMLGDERLNRALGEVGLACRERGLPTPTALIVRSVEKTPASGHFGMFHREAGDDPAKQVEAWQAELAKVKATNYPADLERGQAAVAAVEERPRSGTLGHLRFADSKASPHLVFAGVVTCPRCSMTVNVGVEKHANAVSAKQPAFLIVEATPAAKQIGHLFIGTILSSPVLYYGSLNHCGTEQRLAVFYNRTLRDRYDNHLTIMPSTSGQTNAPADEEEGYKLA